MWNTNKTGIHRLSIGKTKNRHGGYSKRYSVNHVLDKKPTCKTFYFSDNVPQKEAFQQAIKYMRDNDLYEDMLATALAIYSIKDHENLV